MAADLQIEVEGAGADRIAVTVIGQSRLTLLLPRDVARELLTSIDTCMKTGERQTTRSVDVWPALPKPPTYGVHIGIDGASWTCAAMRAADVERIADGIEAELI